MRKPPENTEHFDRVRELRSKGFEATCASSMLELRELRKPRLPMAEA
jgi:hypothetical protein